MRISASASRRWSSVSSGSARFTYVLSSPTASRSSFSAASTALRASCTRPKSSAYSSRGGPGVLMRATLTTAHESEVLGVRLDDNRALADKGAARDGALRDHGQRPVAGIRHLPLRAAHRGGAEAAHRAELAGPAAPEMANRLRLL